MQKFMPPAKAFKGALKWRTSDAQVVHFVARTSVSGLFKCASVAAVALVVAGCLPAYEREQLARDWNQGWAQWKSTDLNAMMNTLTGLDIQPGQANGEIVAYGQSEDDRVLCLHPNSEERVISENGVSDHINYRRCPVSPYPTRSLGERLSPGHIDPIQPNHPLN